MSRYSQRSIQDDSRIVMDISAENGVAIRSSVHMDRFCFFKKGCIDIYIYVCMYIIYIYTCVCVFRLCSCLLGASSPETLLTALERERERHFQHDMTSGVFLLMSHFHMGRS